MPAAWVPVEGAGTPEAGGWFLFGLHGTPTSGVAVQDGTGKGAVDCRSNKIKALVIDAW